MNKFNLTGVEVLLDRLNKDKWVIAGGCARDIFYNRVPRDIDVFMNS